jgi:hypothetical protein
MPLPLLSYMARFNSGAGNGGVTGPAAGLAGGSGQALPAPLDHVGDELLDLLRGIGRLDDLSGPDRPAADGQQADEGGAHGDTLFAQDPLFHEGDWMASRLHDRVLAA